MNLYTEKLKETLEEIEEGEMPSWFLYGSASWYPIVSPRAAGITDLDT